MAVILNIDTSTSKSSVSLAIDGNIIENRESLFVKEHSSKINVFIKEVIDSSKIEFKNIDAIAISKGPGSYTGLRIGVSTAKGLCYSQNIPLIAINSLKIMANGIINSNKIEENSLLCPMIDARRMEVYTALFNNKLNYVSNTNAEILTNESFSNHLKTSKIYFFGDGSDKFKDIIENENAIFIKDIFPSANDMVNLSLEKFKRKEFEDVAYFEPYYLKDFVATTQTKGTINKNI